MSIAREGSMKLERIVLTACVAYRGPGIEGYVHNSPDGHVILRVLNDEAKSFVLRKADGYSESYLVERMREMGFFV